MILIAQLLGQNLIVALAYLLLGKLGLLIALPPGYVSAIWPAAGLAFACIAQWGGQRIGYGIFLGSVLTNATVGGGFHLDGVAVFIAFGSTAQAILGGYWLRRSMPNLTLDGPEKVLRFSKIGIGSAVIAATVGNFVLWSHGFIGLAEVPRSFLTWWLGDAFGVQMFAPLTLLILAPNATWRQRRLSVGLPLLLSFMMCGFVYYFVLEYEQNQLKNRFAEVVAPFSNELLQLDRIEGQALRQLADGYNVRDQVPGPELKKLADNILRLQPVYRAINWAVVMDAQQKARFSGIIKYPDGFHPSASGLVAPVQMITPLEGNASAFGLDLMGEDRRFQSIQKALATHELAMTRPIRLAQDPDGPGGALISAPVQNKHIQGVISAVMDWQRIGDRLKNIPGIQWELQEVLPGAEHVVWKSQAMEMPALVNDTLLDRTGVYQRIHFKLADREWGTVVFWPNAYLAPSASIAPLLILTLALLASGVFSVFTLILSTHRERVESEVLAKTSALNDEIEERRSVQAALEASKMEAITANHAKSAFLANMSHEIRTPMNAILGMLTLLRQTELTPRQTDYASKSDRAARALLGLLNEILDFSKIEAGKMTLDPHPFMLDHMLRDLSVLLSTGVGEKPVEVLFGIDPTLPRELVGDSMRLQQILLNLGSNAIKFTKQGEVMLSIQVLRRTDDAVTLRFNVRDSGIGIAQENQGRIFGGFTQAESTTTRRFGGTGLGLAITQRFVAMMGGELEVQSELGKGSCFYFTVTLPIASQNGAREQKRMRARALGASWRTLVIDDNASAREALVHMGQSLGWQVDLAASGEQALQILQQASEQGIHYQAIFVDWNMPGMDGWQTSQHIRALQASQQRGAGIVHAPVVLMVTAYGREVLSQRSPIEQALLDGYLVKPVTASMLFDAVVDARRDKEQPHPSLVAVQPVRRRLVGMRLLLVEDNLNNQQVASELLAYEGALVQIANHGQEAVEAIAAATNAFDVVLMDLQMPVMDGFSATRVIRDDLQLATLPIVAMTANAMASDREACLAAGMNDHVGKPFDINDLVRILRSQANWEKTPEVPAVAGSGLDQHVVQAAANAGVDLSAALLRLGGKQEVYRRMLTTFIEDLRSMPEQLKGIAQATSPGGTQTEAKRLLHTIKGLAATLGAMPLSGEVAAAEKTVVAGHDTEQAMAAANMACNAIENALPGLLNLLAVLQQEQVNAKIGRLGAIHVDPSLVRSELVPALQSMVLMLQTADMDAISSMAELQLKFGDALGEDTTALEEAVAELDFEKALPLCRDLLRKYFEEGS
jgi:signal transduction histidine kinase/CheY-like chemotaxis protein